LWNQCCDLLISSSEKGEKCTMQFIFGKQIFFSRKKKNSLKNMSFGQFVKMLREGNRGLIKNEFIKNLSQKYLNNEILPKLTSYTLRSFYRISLHFIWNGEQYFMSVEPTNSNEQSSVQIHLLCKEYEKKMVVNNLYQSGIMDYQI